MVLTLSGLFCSGIITDSHHMLGNK
uniref:Uncharacterized protein n=1 Tax=Anguilla anguilla TaxID=7936 RepID=A0A0E9SNU0_ANGAN